MEKSTSRKIIVTGANKGIGYGIVEALCQKKEVPYVVMACRSKEGAEKAKEQLEHKYPAAVGKLVVGIVDVADYESIDQFIDWIGEKLGHVDCLVNNAGIAFKDPGITEDMARKTF